MDPTADPTISIKPWLDLLVSYGWPSIISGMVTWLLWKLIPFIPEWIRASVDAQRQVPIELAKMNQNMEDMVAVTVEGDEQLKLAFRHIAYAVRKKIQGEKDEHVLSEIENAVLATKTKTN